MGVITITMPAQLRNIFNDLHGGWKTTGIWNWYFLTLNSSPKVSTLYYKWVIYQSFFPWWIARKVLSTKFMTAGNWEHWRDKAVTECLFPSANTACVDRSRLTVVHRGGPGAHGNVHMSLYRSSFQWFLSKGSKQIVTHTGRTRPVTHCGALERSAVKW